MYQVYEKCKKVLDCDKKQKPMAIKYCWLMYKQYAEFSEWGFPDAPWDMFYFWLREQNN